MIRLVGDMNPGPKLPPKLPPCNLGRSFNRGQTLRTMTWNTPTLEILFIFAWTAFCVAIYHFLTRKPGSIGSIRRYLGRHKKLY